jgi:hypothetical protein
MGASPRSRRHALLAALAVVLPVALIALAGCGSSGGTTESNTGSGSQTGGPPASESTSNAPPGASVTSCPNNSVSKSPIRVAGASCDEGQATVEAWSHTHSCIRPSMTARSSCSAGRYRCLSVRTERSIAVNCSRQGRSVSFRIDLAQPEAAGR